MHLGTPKSAILSAVIFNALVIPAPRAARAQGRPVPGDQRDGAARRNLFIYGLEGDHAAVPRHQTDRPDRAQRLRRLIQGRIPDPAGDGRRGSRQDVPDVRGEAAAGRGARRRDRLPRAARPPPRRRRSRRVKESLPGCRSQHGCSVNEEMDVDAVIRRTPELALIDELAHTNVQGAKNEKRYEDMDEVLRPGSTSSRR